MILLKIKKFCDFHCIYWDESGRISRPCHKDPAGGTERSPRCQIRLWTPTWRIIKNKQTMEPSLWAELRRKSAEQAGTCTEYLRARWAAPVVRLINRGGSMLVLYKFYLTIKKWKNEALSCATLFFFPSSRCLLASLYLVCGGFLSFSRMQLICSQNRFLSRWWCNWTITGNDPQLHRATSQSILSTTNIWWNEPWWPLKSQIFSEVKYLTACYMKYLDW